MHSRPISRIALAYEAGRDGFWLARWLVQRGIDVQVIHPASVAVSRERKRAKTDRLDAAMLLRVLMGWLRGERGHCGMVAIPTVEERMPAARAASARRLSASAGGSPIGSRAHWFGSASAGSIRCCAEPRNDWSSCAHPKTERCRPT